MAVNQIRVNAISGSCRPTSAVADAAARPKIVAILKVDSSRLLSRSIGAAQLSANPFGGSHQRTMQ